MLFRASVAATFISLLVHLLGWLLSAVITVGTARDGPTGPAKDIQLAVASEQELAQLEEASLALQTPAVADVPTEAPIATGLADATGGEDSGAPDADLGGIGDVLGGGDIASGAGLGLGGAGGGGASFFGVEARGSRFAYIVDVSGSMGFGGKLDATKSEILTSVNALESNARFMVVVFSNPSDTRALGEREGWVSADDSGKRMLRRHVLRLQPLNGTEPLSAFQIVFSLRPKPDAIYFMTDGEFDESVADEVAILNRNAKVPVHCIAFVTRDSEELMRRIARQSEGTYTYVPGPRAPGTAP